MPRERRLTILMSGNTPAPFSAALADGVRESGPYGRDKNAP